MSKVIRTHRVRNEWMTNEIMELLDERRKMKNAEPAWYD